MKKFTFLSAIMLCLMLFINTLFSASPRIVLVEEVTSANCGACAAANGSFYNYLSSNTDKALTVVYHSGNGMAEPMFDANPDLLNYRIGVYVSGSFGTPAAWANGTKLQSLGNVSGEVAKYNNQSSPYSIYVMENRKGNIDTLTVVIKSDVAVSGNKSLFCAVIETPLYFDHAGSNGEKNFYYVARSMYPGPSPSSGFPLNMQAGETRTYQNIITLDPSWNQANTYVVAFIQDLGSSKKEVLQCAKTMTDVSKIYPQIETSGVTFVNFGNVTDNATKAFTITNTGLKPLTITDLSIENDANSVFQIVSTNKPTLLPGDKYDIQVAFNPEVDGDYTAKLRVQSNSKTQNNFTVDLTGKGQGVIQKPKIEVSTSTIDFGDVSDKNEISFDINNTGRGDLLIDDISVENDWDAAFSVESYSNETINPDSTLHVLVTFKPTDNKLFTANLRISTNAGADVLVDLTGTGKGIVQSASIESDLPSLDFGQVSKDNNKDLRFTITNTGLAVLQINSINITGEKGIFVLANNPPTNGIARNDSYSFIINFQPKANMLYTGEVHIISNANNLPDMSIALQGEGIKFPPSAVEDNSGSIMSLTAAPNPVNDLLSIKYNFSENSLIPAYLKIYDIHGIELYSSSLGNLSAGQQSYELNCNGFASGFYFIEISSGANKARVSVVIIH